MEPNSKTEAAESTEADARHDADRPPTTEEAHVAEDAASRVNLDEVGEHFRELSDIGAHVKGEGAVE